MLEGNLRESYLKDQYLSDIAEVYKSLIRWVRWRVEHPQPKDSEKPLCVVFDIDETLVCTYRILFGKPFEINAFPGAVKMFEFVRSLGIEVILVTARDDSLLDITQKMLIRENLSDYKRLYLKERSKNYENNYEYKKQTRQKISEEYTIIASMGDQRIDLGAEEERSFLIFNPFYVVH